MSTMVLRANENTIVMLLSLCFGMDPDNSVSLISCSFPSSSVVSGGSAYHKLENDFLGDNLVTHLNVI